MKLFLLVIHIALFFTVVYGEEVSVESKPLNQNEDNKNDLFMEAQGKVFRWQLNKNDQIKIQKKSNQKVEIIEKGEHSVIDRMVLHDIYLNVIDKNKENGYLLEGSFYSKFNYDADDQIFQEDEKFTSIFYMEPRGNMKVPDGIYMPNVRDIPVFPEIDPLDKKEAMMPGYQWSYPALELIKFNLLIPVPLQADYEYIGREKYKVSGEIMELDSVRISVQINKEITSLDKKAPRKIFGYMTSLLTWDRNRHMPVFVKEEYNVFLLFAGNISQEFHINSETIYSKIKKRENGLSAELLKSEIKEAEGAGSIAITDEKNSVTLSMPDIFFSYKSSELTDHSKELLSKIGKILSKTGDGHKIVVRGHTDNIGSDSFNKKLSEDRAFAVLQYFVNNDILPAEFLSFEGVGDSIPVASNETEEGRAKNRRVEIIINK